MHISYLLEISGVQRTDVQVQVDLEMVDSLETLKEGLSFLLKRYSKQQTKVVAAMVVKQLEMMLSHADSIDFPADRCAFYRLLRAWRVKCL